MTRAHEATSKSRARVSHSCTLTFTPLRPRYRPAAAAADWRATLAPTISNETHSCDVGDSDDEAITGYRAVHAVSSSSCVGARFRLHGQRIAADSAHSFLHLWIVVCYALGVLLSHLK